MSVLPMRSRLSCRWAMMLLTPIMVLAAAPLSADDPPIPITADEAFDAAVEQTDPLTGENALVSLVDLRDPVEIFFSGAPGAVDQIELLDGKIIIPDRGNVHLLHEGKFVEFCLEGHRRRIQVAKLLDLRIRQLAVNVPFLYRTASGWAPNDEFATTINGLHNVDYTGRQVLILFCRTGGRSSSAGKTGGIDRTLFDAVYEIDDDPEWQTEEPGGGVGGFTGSNYKIDTDHMGAYNGHAGFPGRHVEIEEHPSVSWMDAGLPHLFAHISAR